VNASVGGTAAGQGGRRRSETPSFTLEEALHTNAFWVLMVGIAIGSVANNGIPATLAPMFVDRGFPFELAAGALVAYGLASTTAKFVLGWITNRAPLRGVLLLLTLYGAVALSSILLFPSLIGPHAYAFLCGVYIGAYYPLSQMVWAEYFGRAHVGAISALGRPLGLMVGASGPFLLAFTRDLTGGYELGILLNALSAALCFGCLLLVRPARRPARREEAAIATPASST
jgi:cyanate permease